MRLHWHIIWFIVCVCYPPLALVYLSLMVLEHYREIEKLERKYNRQK